MHTIAETSHSEEKDQDRTAPVRDAAVGAVLYGTGSMTLYVLLFCYDSELCRLAEAVNGGDKTLFFVPLLIAFAFSLVHGAFTGHFWELVGLKARR